MASIVNVTKDNRVVVNPGITIKTKDSQVLSSHWCNLISVQFHLVSFLNRDKVYEKIMHTWTKDEGIESEEEPEFENSEEEEEGEEAQASKAR